MFLNGFDYCRNCGHNFLFHIDDSKSKVGYWGNSPMGFYFDIIYTKCLGFDPPNGKPCGNCSEFTPEDNLKYLEQKYEQAN